MGRCIPRPTTKATKSRNRDKNRAWIMLDRRGGGSSRFNWRVTAPPSTFLGGGRGGRIAHDGRASICAQPCNERSETRIKHQSADALLVDGVHYRLGHKQVAI